MVLADGSYQSDGEQVFWRDTVADEVLRVPVGSPLSVRALHSRPVIPEQPRAGERALLQAVAKQRLRTRTIPVTLTQQPPRQHGSDPRPAVEPPTTRDTPMQPTEALDEQFQRALRDGEAALAGALAGVLRVRHDLATVHDLVATCLHDVGASWAAGETRVVDEHRATRTAHQVLSALPVTAPPPARDVEHAPTAPGVVVLATPPGDRHQLALLTLEQRLLEEGHRPLVVEDAPEAELLGVATDAGTSSVVISAHVPWHSPSAQRLLTALRTERPDLLLVVGGPGVPTDAGFLRHHWADLVSSRAEDLLAALAVHGSPLTERERQVLQLVADGLTNGQIAEKLDVASATVKSHLDHVFSKSGTVHRAEAVALALRHRWIR
ncbi:MAG: LuxR C-terminal-related transcriptional regulator [Mycobacteriales bacterium]